jgi:hypothetical protein
MANSRQIETDWVHVSYQESHSEDYLTFFRAAQLARRRRRTALVKELLRELRSGKTREVERGLLTHRTLAEPRFLDGTIEPNDRRIGWCFLGEPEASNSSPAGIARYSTLRAWLSQWSIDDTNARALHNASHIHIPLLAVENSADDAVPQPHTWLFFDAVGDLAHVWWTRLKEHNCSEGGVQWNASLARSIAGSSGSSPTGGSR